MQVYTIIIEGKQKLSNEMFNYGQINMAQVEDLARLSCKLNNNSRTSK